MKRIKVLVVGLSQNLGGVETYAMYQFRNIDKNIFQWDFIDIYNHAPIAFEDEIRLQGSQVYHLDRSYKVWKKFLSEHSYYDFIIFNIVTPFRKPIKLCCKYGNFKKVIVHSHSGNLDCPIFFKPIMEMLLSFERCKLRNLPIQRWACSKYAADWMFGKNSEYTFIKNGIDILNFKYNADVRKAVRNELKLDDDCYCIGHIGRFDTQKNHKYLIRVFSEYLKLDPKAKLLLVGAAVNCSEYDNVKKLILELGLKDNIIELGLRKDVERLYQAMDIFLLPSLFEGLPVVGIEAQASGLPVIYSEFVTPEVKILDCTCFLPIDSDAKSQWCKEISKCKKMVYDRENAWRQVKAAGFDISDETKNVEKILRQLYK